MCKHHCGTNSLEKLELRLLLDAVGEFKKNRKEMYEQ